jgi:nucleotide-binding universal stress UspA family protein
MFQHLLVPLDFGAGSEHAAKLAVAIATKFQSKLDLFHALYIPPLAYGDGTMPAYVPYDDIFRGAREALDLAHAKIKERYPSAEALLVDGEPRERIVEVAAERGVDLIVMGTHGRRGLSHAFFGSVAERVVRTSPVPVLTTGSSEGGDTFRHVLVATDFGEPAEHAVATASELATKFDAKLTLVHAYAMPTTIYDERAYWPTAEIIKNAEIALAGALAKTRERAPAAESVLVRGDAREGILAVARERKADLVVMGTHGRRGLPRMFLGSVAERVVQVSPVPVLTVGAPVKASDAKR